MVAPSNANPAFYRGVVREFDAVAKQDRDRTVIYSLLDDLWVGQIPHADRYVEQIPPGRNLTIHALNLTLLGEISVPRGDVRIYCRKLSVPAGEKDATTGEDLPGTVLDVSPPDLPPTYADSFHPNALMDVGGDGTNGDVIATSLQGRLGQKYGASDAQMYELIGKPGADAGSVTIVCDEIELEGRLLLRTAGGKGYPGSDGQQGGPAADQVNGSGGTGGKGGQGGPGGNGGAIVLHYRQVNNQAWLETDATPGEPGKPGNPGQPGPPRGELGGYAEAGEPSASGDIDENDEIELNELGQACDDVFLLRLVQKCKHIYLFNQPTKFTGDKVTYPERWKELGDLLDWTSNVLATYAEVPSTASRGDLRKNDLYLTVHNMLSSYKGGLTYDSVAPDWVPATPIETMFAEFSRAFAGRAKLEQHFLHLSAENIKAVDAENALNDARGSVAAAKSLHEAVYAALCKQLNDEVPGQVATARAGFAKAKEHLESALKDIQQKVNDHFQCKFADVLKAAEMMAFTVGDPVMAGGMGTVEVASLVNDGLTKIDDDRGKRIDKSELVGEITSVSGDLKTAALGALFVLEDGKPVLAPGKKLLLTDIDKFKNEIKSFSGALGNDATDTVAGALDDFTAALYEQGQALLLYNMLMMRMVAEYRAYQDADKQVSALANAPDPISPSWVSTVSYFAKLYQDELENTAVAVADLQRKVAYLTLDVQEDLNLMKRMGSLWLDAPPPDADDMDQLGDQITTLHEQIGKFASGQPSASGRVPERERMRSDLFVYISAGVLLDEFKQKQKDGSYSLTITTVPGTPKDAHELAVSNASRYYDIRVTAVQPRIIGAKSRQGKVAIEARVAARTATLDKKGDKHTFYLRYARDTGVVHRVDTTLSGETYDDSGSGSGGRLTDDFLDRVGLYGKWTLTCPAPVTANDDNDGLDVSGVTAIVIYFDCYARHP